MTTESRSLFSTALYFGALWGLSEAVLGYLLHLAGRVLPIPGLAGMVLFPLACYLMLKALSAAGTPTVIPLSAVAAAFTKFASALHPAIDPIFVINPGTAVLAEGLVIWLTVSLLLRNRAGNGTAVRMTAGVTASVAWRLIFLAAVLLLPMQKGILMKGSSAILSFLLIEGVIAGILFGLVLKLLPASAEQRNRTEPARRSLLLPELLLLGTAGMQTLTGLL